MRSEWVLAGSGAPLWIFGELQSAGKPWAASRGEDILGRSWHVSLGVWEGHSVGFCVFALN